MSENDQITEDTKDIEALLNRTFALEVLVTIMMRDHLRPDQVNRILQRLREQAVYPPLPAGNVEYLRKPSSALSLALEQLHEDISKAVIR